MLTNLLPRASRSDSGFQNGSVSTATVYFDKAGRRHTAAYPVPIDDYGQLTRAQYRCRKCKTVKWMGLNLPAKPVCDVDYCQMDKIDIKAAPLLPWNAIWAAVKPALRPVWPLAATAAAGYGAYAGHVGPVAPLLAAVPAGVMAMRVADAKMAKKAIKRGRITDKNEQSRYRSKLARRARAAGYYTSAAFAWMSVPAAAGLDPHTFGGCVSWTAFAAIGVWPTATWWRYLRRLRAEWETRREQQSVEPETQMDQDEAQTRKVWSTVVAAEKGQIIGVDSDGKQITAPRKGCLAETWLEDWRNVVGGWSATIVGPDGLYTSEMFARARGPIASAFKMKTSMITIEPDPEDENRALILAQRTSPLTGEVKWHGPESIDVERGTAPIGVYADGELAMYEIYRPKWGSPHVGAFGTTGSGKSEMLSLLFAIDRWAHCERDGEKKGLVASFLIDPQQGQSYAPFLDDLAAPVAVTLDEAKLLAKALHAEMVRRQRYLARDAKTWDARRKKWRAGRKWWNPLIDGPIITLTIDEAHAFLPDREFTAMICGASRMWRKCGGQIRLGTHTSLLSDLGGDIALRGMLTGGFVWVGRTADRLTGPTAFNGRLPADPCTLDAIPGMAYVLGQGTKGMKIRTMWEEDWYDWVRDLDDKPIGYPGELPPETLAAFGSKYAEWVKHAADGDRDQLDEWLAKESEPVSAPEPPKTCVDAVASTLLSRQSAGADSADMDAIVAALQKSGLEFSVRTIRDALKKLRDAGHVETVDGKHRAICQWEG